MSTENERNTIGEAVAAGVGPRLVLVQRLA